MAINDIGIHYSHPDLQSKLWINTPEDSNHNGTFEPWPSTQTFNDKSGDLDNDDDDGNGYKDDVIGGDFTDYIIFGDTFVVCGGIVDCDGGGPPSPTPPIEVCDVNCPDGPPPPGCILVVCADSIRPGGLFPAPDSTGGGKPHGTWVASVAAAAGDNGGAVGAALNSRLLAITSSRQKISGNVAGIVYAQQMAKLKHKKMVINMSWWATENRDKSALEMVLKDAAKDSVVMVVCAGNRDRDTALYPASDTNVISVSGLDTADFRPTTPPGVTYNATYNLSVDISAPWEHWVASADNEGNPPAYYWNYTNYTAPTPSQSCVSPLNGTGTSFSAPLVAGVAALIKSVYPHFNNAEVRAKLRSSTDPIRFENLPDDSLEWGNKMGAGRLNAFKALTFFGNIPGEFANDTTLSGTVYVSGDITVRNGKTLQLAAGTLLRFYPGDVMKKGVDTAKTEIVVEAGGKLIIEGTPSSPVKLVSFRREQAPYDSTTTNDWQGIVVRPGGYISVSNAIIRHAYAGIEDSSRYLHTIKNVRIGRCKMYGILAVNTDSLTIRGCRVDSINANPGGWGIYIDTVYSGGKGARLVKDTVWASYTGIYIEGSTAPIDTCYVQGSVGWLPSHTGIVTLQQAGSDTLRITATKINGFFAHQHMENGLNGRIIVSACTLISPSSPSRSPYIIRSTAANTYLRLRRSRLFEWQDMGVYLLHLNGQVANLGTVSSPADSGFNVILTGSTSPNWKYVYDGNCGGCATPVIKAEWNCFGANPLASRFSTNIDRLPLDYSCAEAPPKIATEQEKEILPKATELYQNYPNPFNPTTQIQFNLERPEKVRLEIFNLLGQMVRTMVAGEEFAAGPYTFLWDGKDNRGSPLSSGVYFYRLKTPTYLKTHKMMLVK